MKRRTHPLRRAAAVRRPKWPLVRFHVPPCVRFRVTEPTTLHPPLVPAPQRFEPGDHVEIAAGDWLGEPDRYRYAIDALRRYPSLMELPS